MVTRGVLVSYDTVWCWCDKFGKQYADASEDDVLEPVISSTSTKSFSRSTASLTISGEQSISTALSSTF